MSQISIDAVGQTLARSVKPEGIDEMLKADPTPDTQGDRGAALQDEQVKSVEDENCLLEQAKTVDHKVVDEETSVD